MRWALNLPGPVAPKRVSEACGTAAKRYLALNHPPVDAASEVVHEALQAQMMRAIAAAALLADGLLADVFVTVSGDLAPDAIPGAPGAAVTVTVQESA